MAIVTRDILTGYLTELIGERTDDDALKIIEDTKDTLDDYDKKVGEDWKKKYEDNDKEWRQKYKERFSQATTSTVDVTIKDDDEDEEKVYTYEALFKTE